MRKFLIPLLAASMLVPAAAIAQDRDFGRGDRDRSERSERSDDRRQRADRPARSERADRPARIERTERIERADRQQRIERRIERNDDSMLGGLRAMARRQSDRDAVETRRDRDRRRALVADGARRDRDSDGRRDWRRDRDDDRRWSRDWRHDRRYDWHSYRNRYGSLFRLGRYYDPYGYRYRRFSIGLSLWPHYYRSRYWLNDPWHYRLPPAYGPYRWVRYYDDALLVNIYTGHVVDVIYNVFW